MSQVSPTAMAPIPSKKTGPRHLVCMGTSGCGKTTIAMMLAGKLGYVFAEGDEFHSEHNRQKMSSGIPLTDEDRWPWLGMIRDWMSQEAAVGRSTVVSCSALKESYRDLLREADGDVVFIHTYVDPEVIAKRMEAREHFMPVSLLESQLKTLEPLGEQERGITVENKGTPEDLLVSVLYELEEKIS